MQLQCSYANDIQLQKCSQRPCFRFCVFGFEGLLLVYIAYPRRFTKTDVLFADKILFFEIETKLQHHLLILPLLKELQHGLLVILKPLNKQFW